MCLCIFFLLRTDHIRVIDGLRLSTSVFQFETPIACVLRTRIIRSPHLQAQAALGAIAPTG